MNATANWEDVQNTSKATRVAVPIEEQLTDMVSRWASLDLQPTEEFQFEDPCSESSSEGCDRNEESKLPPPIPYYDRKSHTLAPVPMLTQASCHGSSPSRICAKSDRKKTPAPERNDTEHAESLTRGVPLLGSPPSRATRPSPSRMSSDPHLSASVSLICSRWSSGTAAGRSSTARCQSRSRQPRSVAVGERRAAQAGGIAVIRSIDARSRFMH
jgi:hypothetical protein